MAEVTVLFDRVAWYDDDGDRWFADAGETVTMPDKEADRLRGLRAVGDADEYVPREVRMEMARAATRNRMTGGQTGEVEGVTRANLADRREAAQVDDDRLASMTVDEIVAHLQQHPQDVDRVDALEERRPSRRRGVDETLDTIRAHRS